MSGSQRNSWSSYLNGGTSQYNFSYKDNSSSDTPMMAMPSTPLQVSNTENVKNKKVNSGTTVNKIVNKKINGGKRKSRRHTKNKHRK
jgi:hypothetical protein